MLSIKADLWERLADCDRPILLYGMGNGADKILAVCAARGIPVADCFASDGFVRGQIFHGKRVLSFSEAEEKYGEMVVLLSFATARPEVYELIKMVASRHTLYVPDVPVAGDTLFDRAYYLAHSAEFDAARALLADEASRVCFDRVLYGKLTGALDTIFSAACAEDEVWQTVLRPARYTAYGDLGAYNGDTIRALMGHAPSLATVYAMEPDPRNYRKLCDWGNSTTLALTTACAAAWDKAGEGLFAGSGNRNAALTSGSAPLRKNDGKREAVPLMPPDALFADARIDFIKYDVEGAEEQALRGSAETIRRAHPDLLVSAYHRASDLYLLPKLMHTLCPDHKLYLRKLPSIPMWDVNLYAIGE